MMDPHSESWNCVAALFSYEFHGSGTGNGDGNGIDYDTIEAVHRGDVGEWVTALQSAGLFDRAVVEDVAAAWRRQPRLLLDMLLVDADEMTRKRCAMAWISLDRLAPLAQFG